ncbi:MAG: hypothetical protein KAT15_03890 [Bacteroidales bacterium]|nr:hypothetical protein [Bacteroidales bacterium]
MLLPVITLIIFWAVRVDGNFFQFLENFQQLGMLSKALSLSTIPNLLLFFLFLWTDRSFSARGVIFATLVMAFVMLVLKFA